MTRSEITAGPASEALVSAGWLRLQDRLLGGVVHDLSGRASALGGLAALLGRGEEMDLLPHIDEEVRRLAHLAVRMRLLLGDPDAAPEPMVVPDVLPGLAALQERERDMEAGTLETLVLEEPPPVLVNWAAFSRLVLLALSAVRRAAPADAHTVVAVGPTEDGGLELSLACRDVEGMAIPELEALTKVAASQGGSAARWGESGLAFRLPSLAQARRADS